MKPYSSRCNKTARVPDGLVPILLSVGSSDVPLVGYLVLPLVPKKVFSLVPKTRKAYHRGAMTDRLASPPLPTPYPLTGTHSLIDSPLVEYWHLKKRTSAPSSPLPKHHSLLISGTSCWKGLSMNQVVLQQMPVECPVSQF